MVKTCSRCKQEFTLTEEYFYRTKKNTDGFFGTCKSCAKAYFKEYKAKNREYISKRKEDYRLKNITEIKERGRVYRENNKDKCRERFKRFYEANKESRIDYSKNWNKTHPENRRITSQLRESRKKNLPATLTEKQWEYIKDHFNSRCAYCGKEKPLCQEHFIPLSKGGEYTHNNIIPACVSCNTSKGASDFQEWYPRKKFYSIKRERKILKFLGYDNQLNQQQPSLMV